MYIMFAIYESAEKGKFTMKEITYENQNNKNRYETYEWDNTWIEHANDTNIKRVLYIGDSISCGIRRIATELTNDEILFDGLGTSKGIDNPCFKNTIRLFALQQPDRKAVIFNNGLHGWHLDDETEYKACYEEMIKFILSEFPATPLAVVSTTAVLNTGQNNRVRARNKVANEIAEKYSLPVIDLYRLSAENIELLSEDGVHFQPEGYEILAAEIVRICREIIG